MNKVECYPVGDVNAVEIHMGWSDISLEISQIDTLQIVLSGDDDTVEGVHPVLSDGTLHADLPVRERMPNLISTQWLQTVVRLPMAWRGSLEVHTTSGNVNLNGVSGTDLDVESISGQLKATRIHGMSVSLQTVSGPILAEKLTAETAKLHSISGPINTVELDARNVHLSTVSGAAECMFTDVFTRFDGNSVSGSVRILTPMTEVNAVLKTVSGRLLTENISIRETGPQLRFTTVNGNLEIVGNIPVHGSPA